MLRYKTLVHTPTPIFKHGHEEIDERSADEVYTLYRCSPGYKIVGITQVYLCFDIFHLIIFVAKSLYKS